MLLLLARHAQSTLNFEQRVNGDPAVGVPLTEQRGFRLGQGCIEHHERLARAHRLPVDDVDRPHDASVGRLNDLDPAAS